MWVFDCSGSWTSVVGGLADMIMIGALFRTAGIVWRRHFLAVWSADGYAGHADPPLCPPLIGAPTEITGACLKFKIISIT